MIKDRTLRMALLNNDLPILRPLTRQLVVRFKEAEQQSLSYKKKIARLEEENAGLRQRLLDFELSEENK